MSEQGNQPAFPIPLNPGELHTEQEAGGPNGMTLRDYFAAKAMQGIISVSVEEDAVWYDEDHVARNAYYMADAMLSEREK